MNTLKILLFGLLCVFFKDAYSQVNHPYPRTVVQHFGQGVPEFYARYDLVIISRTDIEEVRAIKKINPDAIVLSTHTWTQWDKNHGIKPFPQAWYARDSQGATLAPDHNDPLINVSNHCPLVNGQRYNQAMPEFLKGDVDLSVFDGIGTDWAWGKPHKVTDIDLDGNGKNDFVEYGSEWVIATWQEGLIDMISRVRANMGPDKILWVNSGGFHEWGLDKTNGTNLDHWSGFFSWKYFMREYRTFMQTALEPHVFVMAARPWRDDPHKPADTRNYLQFMRFMLCATLMGDGYFQFQPLEAGENHYYFYHDEYDTDLGFATSEAQELANGCYVRFFENGAAIVNPTGATQIVRDSDLAALAGANPPYFRFKGNQDPVHNNGQKFDSIMLDGFINPKGNGQLVTGDGIVLLRQPRTVVADIIIDNLPYGTTPMMDAVKLSGNWEQTSTGGNHYRSIDRADRGWYPHAAVSGGDGSATARFQPTLAYAGKYEIFEWHGYFRPGQMATNVPVTLDVNGKKTTWTVDQSQKQGQWNSLGIVDLPAGKSTSIVITNDTNGYVVADAIKFEFLTKGEDHDRKAPKPPTGVQVSGKN
ncbi:MAG: hypothetical protein ACE5IR_01885 [bacterium]